MAKLLRSLSESLHKLPKAEFNAICIKISHTPLKTKEQRSFNSLKIKYFINNDIYHGAKTIIETAPNLMKRDYLNYLNYLYKINSDESRKIFSTIVPKYEFLNKDIKFIIDNEMFGLLFYLNNFYNYIDNDINDVEVLESMKYIVPFSDHKKKQMLEYISTKFKSPVEKKKLDDFLKDVDVVIDGGNISYFRGQGKLNYRFFNQIINNIQSNYSNPLLIIHPRHIKNKIVGDSLKKNKIRYFITSRNVNDDYYMIYSIINNNCDVVTLDNFKDHIFELSTQFSDTNNFIRNYIDEKIIKYDESSICEKPRFSKCIQVLNDAVYVPTRIGFKKFKC